MVVALLIATRGALHAVRLDQASRLLWDGQSWQIERVCGARSSASIAVVHLDLQALLLVRLNLKTGAMLWVWLERSADAAHWLGIRRALHARADTSLKSAASPNLSS